MFFNATNNNRNRQHDFRKGNFGNRCKNSFWENRESFKQMFAQKMNSNPVVNIEEREEDFLLCVYAAGLEKDKFKLSVQDNILTISYEPETQTSERKFIYQENNLDSFERSFQLNGQIVTDQISAAYIDGVLVVNLPKNDEAKQPEQEIKIN